VASLADGGSLAIGIGAFEQARKSTEGLARTFEIANKLIEFEEKAIRHIRETFGIELKPW